METAIIVFMVLVGLIAALSLGLTLYDVIAGIRQKRRAAAENARMPIETERRDAPAEASTADVSEVMTAEMADVAQIAAATDGAIENGVAFALGRPQTLTEKYFELSEEAKNFFKEVSMHAAKKNKARRIETNGNIVYKIGQTQLVKLTIKRGTVVCEFLIPNSDFRNYIEIHKVKVRQRPIILKVADERSLKTAKDSVDLIERMTVADTETKKNLARERRKAKLAPNNDTQSPNSTIVIEHIKEG